MIDGQNCSDISRERYRATMTDLFFSKMEGIHKLLSNLISWIYRNVRKRRGGRERKKILTKTTCRLKNFCKQQTKFTFLKGIEVTWAFRTWTSFTGT